MTRWTNEKGAYPKEKQDEELVKQQNLSTNIHHLTLVVVMTRESAKSDASTSHTGCLLEDLGGEGVR